MLFLLSLAGYALSMVAPVDGTYWVQYNNSTMSTYYLTASGFTAGKPAVPNVVVSNSGGWYSFVVNGITVFKYYSTQLAALTYVLSTAPITTASSASTTTASTTPGPSVSISQGTFAGFPWKAINSSSSVVLNFTANVPTTDLTIGLRYSATNCVEIVVGGWFNSRSVVRDVNYSTGISVITEYQATSPSPPIAQLNAAIKYVLTIANGTLTITGTLPSGATYTVLTYSSSFLNKTFTGYSFRGCPPYTWTVSADFLGSTSSASTTTTTSTTASSQVIRDGNYWIQYSSTYPNYYSTGSSMNFITTKPTSANYLIQYVASSGAYTLKDALTGAVVGTYTAASATAFSGRPWILVFGSAVSSSTTSTTYTGTYPKAGDSGFDYPGVQTAMATTSQADADAAAKNKWQTMRLSWLQSAGGTVVNGATYATFGWKNVSAPGQNIKLTFSALATTDLYIGLQYSTYYYIEIVLGGWGNIKSVVRTFYNNAQQGGDYAVTSPNPVIPDTSNPVLYTLTINGGVLTIAAQRASGAMSTVLSYSSSILNQTFTAYSFRASDVNAFRVSNDSMIPLAFTGNYNGYSVQSTISQADADAKALAAWSTAIVTSITNSKNTALSAFNTVNTALSSQLTVLNTARNALKNVAVNIPGFTGKLPWE